MVWGAVGDPGGRIYPGVRYLKVALGSFHSNYGSSSPLCYTEISGPKMFRGSVATNLDNSQVGFCVTN